MTTRYLIAAALMASACAAHADVLPVTTPQATVVNGNNVAGALGDASLIAGVSRGAGSEAMVQALYDKVSAAVGNDMKVSLKQGLDGVYVQGLSTAKAAALAGDGMSVINTSEGFKVIQALTAGGSYVAGSPNGGGGAATGTPSSGSGTSSSGTSGSSGTVTAGTPGNSGGAGNSGANGAPGNSGNAGNSGSVGAGAGLGNGNGNGNGSAQADATAVPEPSTVFLMLAGMLGVVGIRRRAR